MLPSDLEQLIFKFGGVHYPMKTIARLDSGVMERWYQNNCAFYRSFLQKWTPSYCNVLKWTPTFEHEQRYFWHYDVLTHFAPDHEREGEHASGECGVGPDIPWGPSLPHIPGSL